MMAKDIPWRRLGSSHVAVFARLDAAKRGEMINRHRLNPDASRSKLYRLLVNPALVCCRNLAH
jgi:hypothetical protein